MRSIVLFFTVLFISSNSYGQILYRKSFYNYETTVQKVEEIIFSKNLQIVARIDHAKSAAINKLYLPPSILIIFGNAQIGTALIQDNPLWSLHLPLKVSIYDDIKGNTWIAIPDLRRIAKKNCLCKEPMKKLDVMVNFLNKILNVK